MTALNPRRRTMTARQAAEALGVSVATVRRHTAEPRPIFEARAAARRAQALVLQGRGLTYPQIAVAMETTVPAVKSLLQRARREKTPAGA